MTRHLVKSTICSIALLAGSGDLNAQDQTRAEALQAEVTSCTTRALDGKLEMMEMFHWVQSCQGTAEGKCRSQPLDPKDVTPSGRSVFLCEEYSGVAWQNAADQIKARLIARWQSCAVSDGTKAAMIERIERLDAATIALGEAACDYDVAQWQAFEENDIETVINRRRRCPADIETGRAAVLYNYFVLDMGCGNLLKQP